MSPLRSTDLGVEWAPFCWMIQNFKTGCFCEAKSDSVHGKRVPSAYTESGSLKCVNKYRRGTIVYILAPLLHAHRTTSGEIAGSCTLAEDKFPMTSAETTVPFATIPGPRGSSMSTSAPLMLVSLELTCLPVLCAAGR